VIADGRIKDFREEDGHHVHARGLLPVLARLAVQAGDSFLMHGFMLHKKDMTTWKEGAARLLRSSYAFQQKLLF
jgi:hypothetical protein